MRAITIQKWIAIVGFMINFLIAGGGGSLVASEQPNLAGSKGIGKNEPSFERVSGRVHPVRKTENLSRSNKFCGRAGSQLIRPIPDKEFFSNGVKVAILDSGCNIEYQEGISLIDATVKDYNGHGTLMAGIIKEINPQAELYIIKVINRYGLAVNQEAVILGLEWAVSRGVDVVDISLRLKHSEKLHQAIKKAYDKGIVITAAAGNRDAVSGERLSVIGGEKQPQTANRKPQTDAVAYPAKYPETISVGALNKHGKVYAASMRGENVDVYCQGYKGDKAGTSVASAYAAGLASKIILDNPGVNMPEIIGFICWQTQKCESIPSISFER